MFNFPELQSLYFLMKIDTLGKQPWLIIQAKEMVIHSDSKDTE